MKRTSNLTGVTKVMLAHLDIQFRKECKGIRVGTSSTRE